jgi:hypothetical protein
MTKNPRFRRVVGGSIIIAESASPAMIAHIDHLIDHHGYTTGRFMAAQGTPLWDSIASIRFDEGAGIHVGDSN